MLRFFTLFFIFFLFLYGCEGTDSSFSEKKNSPGINDNEIIIGSSLPTSGHASYLGTQINKGALSYINRINDGGGVNGRKIKLITLDDRYHPPMCLVNTQDLIIKDKVFTLFCYVGTPTTEKILPMVEEAKIPLIGIFTGASSLRKSDYSNIINIRASYYQETEAAVKYFVEEVKKENFAVFYQYDAYGFDGLRGTEKALQNYGKVPVATGKYIRGTLDIESGLEKILSSDADVVFLIGTYDPCAKFIIEAKRRGFKGDFYNLSFVGARALLEKTGEYGEGVIVSQVVPPSDAGREDPLLWGVRKYRDDLKRSYPDETPNFVSFEGYINAVVLVEGLKRTGHDITRTGFIEAIESIKDYDIGIKSRINFGTSDHQGLDRVYFTKITNGKLILIK